ncbi:MAG: CopG family transcriptional regulator [Deltaproteobacteria bacterium]|nr:CopG family transcriptional regulator [Deltaproteobacteria bacterium]
MAHRTQLYLDDSQYHYIKDLARSEGKSVAQLIRDWIEERRKRRVAKKYANDPFIKGRGLFNSGRPDMGENFDDYLYGDKK